MKTGFPQIQFADFPSQKMPCYVPKTEREFPFWGRYR